MKSGWKYVKLGELASYINGFAFKPSDWSESGKPIIRIQNLTDAFSSFHYCNRDDIPKKYIINKGDILISWSATLGIFEWLSGEALLNQHIFKVVFNKQPINKYFFKYAIHNSLDEMSKHTNGATMRHIRKGDFDNIQIPIPPLTEQGEIVAYLDKEFALIDALREKATQQLQATKDLFQTQLKQLLTPKQGWEEKRLCDVSDYYNGLTYKPTDVNNKGWIVLRSSNIKNNKLDLSDLVRVNIPIKDRLKVKKGDLIMCSRNGSKSLIGKVALIPENREDLTFGAFMMIFKSQISNYLFYYFLSEQFKKQIWKGEATMINQITRYMLDDVTIPLPSLSEQEEIVRKLDALSEQCRQLEENYRQTISLCNDLKRALLRQVFE